MATTTYKPSNTATYGSKGSAVSAYQTQLNNQNKGVAGYVPLKVDGMYGPLTQAASQFKAPTTIATTTKTQAGPVIPTGTYESPEVKAARDAQISYLNNIKQPDENSIWNQTMGRFQSQIDAVNAIYADEVANAKIQGTGRLGTQTAMSARRGLIGSDFGEANFKNQEGENNQVLRMIDNEKQQKLAVLMGQARNDASAELKSRREEFTKGLDARLAYYTAADQRKVDNSGKAIKSLIAQGLNPKEIDKSQLGQFAKYYGISSDDILTGYDEAKNASDAEKKKLENETTKAQPASVQEYEYAKANGFTGTYSQYQNDDANRKAVVAKAGASRSGLTPYQQFSATQSIAKDNEKRTENAREMSRQANLIKSSYASIKSGGNRSLNTQAIITSFNKILDPTSVVRESEYDRTAAGQSLLAQLQGKYDNIVSGGAGVTLATLEEASNIATRYLEGATQSIATQNKRAQAMAAQFGLNQDFVSSVGVIGSEGVDGNSNDPDPLGLGL